MTTERNFSCSFPPVTLGECSGNGRCVYSPIYERGVCECFPGFRGNADFRTSSSLVDCHISNTAIIVLWSVTLVIVTLFALSVYRDVYDIVQFHRATNARLVKAGKAPVSVFSNKAFTALIPFTVLGFPLTILTACLRIAAQESHVIGVNWFISIVWFLTRTVFYFSAMRFQPALIESLLRGQRACEEVITQNKIVANIVLLLVVASMFFVLAPLLASPTGPFDFFWGRFAYLFSCAALALVMAITAAQALFATRKINEVLIASYESTRDERTLAIATRLKQLQRGFLKQQITQLVLQVFIICAPFMWDKYDYIYVITSMATAQIGFSAIRSIAAIQRQSSASKSSRGAKKTVATSGLDDEIVPAAGEDSTTHDFS